MEGMGNMGGGTKGVGMGDTGKMNVDLNSTPKIPDKHPQHDMSKHTSVEMEKCLKTVMPEMEKMVGYGGGGGMRKMGGM